LYSRFLSGEKKKIDDMTDVTTPSDVTQNANLRELRTELMRDHLAKKLDGYGLYLYGIVLKRLELLKEAMEVLVEAVHKEPMHWGSWLELAALITDRAKVSNSKGNTCP
jgi:anaphase-promoting complex subunit 8